MCSIMIMEKRKKVIELYSESKDFRDKIYPLMKLSITVGISKSISEEVSIACVIELRRIRIIFILKIKQLKDLYKDNLISEIRYLKESKEAYKEKTFYTKQIKGIKSKVCVNI